MGRIYVYLREKNGNVGDGYGRRKRTVREEKCSCLVLRTRTRVLRPSSKNLVLRIFTCLLATPFGDRGNNIEKVSYYKWDNRVFYAP